ncbi:hydroxyacylglutathione hydrolase [Acetobacter orleanensis]|uniref:Hydroxyacylglutathione hydrolase n=1 Tax=Acetobacter orleanensis TaxID=104099 RepID=A0A4Y3TLZ1_9PROT|nr:hydroxyacylglutathione hydrolase [Acetobacter orleanensis]KXV62841.1 hydroxyacylglutathione hydrolase [Acetobacter orleanensis]PCD80618.1 hydroxyacylglutathione hydrolase [Acetobacter orleanensis]GAN68050.1 hydroxyacylglutathione hydrolase [Acetobacter orleanensis JCM 7639]GBR27221.1 hydroxyacylglutathione hydrolase [Acetobacter orleanensis NRIC 0473]GEB82027.1 hydroxyacylglutathione hydrolase [Acetobacter orleanensis]
MSLQTRAIPVLSDNYSWLLQDTATGCTAIVDPGEAAPIQAVLDAAGGRLDLILLTHHHADHVGGTDALRARYKARVAGPAAEQARMPALDIALKDKETIAVGHSQGHVLAVPGHTLGHISYYFADPPTLFCGDTLFSLGCGRLFEGTAEQLFESLKRFASLPDETLVCCGHEYTQSNCAFALHAEPDNAALKARAAEVKRLRAEGRATVPSTLGQERATNPFLRAADVLTLARLRREKDTF